MNKVELGMIVKNCWGDKFLIDSINGEDVTLRFFGPSGSATITREIDFIKTFYEEAEHE